MVDSSWGGWDAQTHKEGGVRENLYGRLNMHHVELIYMLAGTTYPVTGTDGCMLAIYTIIVSAGPFQSQSGLALLVGCCAQRGMDGVYLNHVIFFDI